MATSPCELIFMEGTVSTVIYRNEENGYTILRLDVRGEEIGIIEERQLLDLFCEHLAPIVYNKALDDSMRWLKEQVGNIEVDYYLLYKDVE